MKKGLAVAMAALLGVATMGTTAMAAASGDITICSREDGSGTRGAFIELFGIEEKDADGGQGDTGCSENTSGEPGFYKTRIISDYPQVDQSVQQ